MKKIILLILLSFSLSGCFKQKWEVDVDRVEGIINKFNKSGNFSGVALISKGNKIVYELASGYKNKDKEKIDIDSQFLVASITKQFTAVALMKCLYEKSLPVYRNEQEAIAAVKRDLNLPLSLFLNISNPIWKGDMPKWADKVTLHQMLSNTSGIPNYKAIDNYESSREEFKGIDNQLGKQLHVSSDIISLIKNYSLKFKPGTSYDYSNTNFFLLGLVIESISGIPYDRYVEDKVFKVLGMNSTKNPRDGNASKLKNREGYESLVDQIFYNPFDINDPLEINSSYTNMITTQATSSLISTARDLQKWTQALHKDFTILPQELYSLMLVNYAKDFDDLYGYGIMPIESKYMTAYAHTGGLDGFQSALIYFKEDDVTVVILSNTAPNIKIFEKKVDEIASNLKSKVANPDTRKKIAQSRIEAQYSNIKKFINMIDEIEKATIYKYDSKHL